MRLSNNTYYLLRERERARECVILAKCGPDDTLYHRRGLEYFVRTADFCQRDTDAAVQDAVTKLYRCVVEIKMKAEEFVDGCGPSKDTKRKGERSREAGVIPSYDGL